MSDSKRRFRAIRKRAIALLQHALRPGEIVAYWHVNDVNWGDAVNPILIEHLSGKVPRFTKNEFTDKYMVVGSILHLADPYTTVWGAGLIEKGRAVRGKPKAIHAVRGPLSRKELLEQGIDAPEVYGDPALLLPFFFDPQVPKKYEVGIIPHYVDKTHPWIEPFRKDPSVLIIDVQGGHREFVEAIKSCHRVLSSSLHGVICADAYGVPSTWVEFSNDVVGAGFKFYDYFESVHREPIPAVRITDGLPLAKVLAGSRDYKIQFDRSALFHSCPFLSPEVRQRWKD